MKQLKIRTINSFLELIKVLKIKEMWLFSKKRAIKNSGTFHIIISYIFYRVKVTIKRYYYFLTRSTTPSFLNELPKNNIVYLNKLTKRTWGIKRRRYYYKIYKGRFIICFNNRANLLSIIIFIIHPVSFCKNKIWQSIWSFRNCFKFFEIFKNYLKIIFILKFIKLN